ncbi:uncharacterized protein LOC34621338 [Cyclospora cayetanensis]|uniref:Uncharacterized protein LOC34621338 n=1 Tax=Cyclospora cayetanensis TaxID=88456 RepID=A0A6P6RPA2_9EIME|nr:uncharacterized protein LOC34621338 [Cyclospora cayetanensis]
MITHAAQESAGEAARRLPAVWAFKHLAHPTRLLRVNQNSCPPTEAPSARTVVCGPRNRCGVTLWATPPIDALCTSSRTAQLSAAVQRGRQAQPHWPITFMPPCVPRAAGTSPARNEIVKGSSLLSIPEEATAQQATNDAVDFTADWRYVKLSLIVLCVEPRSTFGASRPRLPVHRPLVRGVIPAEAQFVSWDAPIQPSHPKSLTVALIGPPNAGKSSLLNAFLGVTVSAVSNKVNTTRTDFRGMVTKGNNQLIFVDAPGIIESHPKKTFCRDLVNAAWRGYEDADLGILVVDTVKRPTQNIFNVVRAIAPKPSLALSGFQHSARSREEPTSVVACSPSLYEMREAGISGTLRQRLALDSSYAEVDGGARTIPIILCLNKIDLASHPRWIYAREKEFGSHGHFQRAFHVSAKYRRGTELLMDYLFNQAVSRPWTYPSDMRTSLSKVQQVEELIRTYLFCWFNKDVPYRVTQETVGWATQEDGSVVIEQELLVKSDQVAKMICGIRGRILLQMRKNVTYKLEQLWGHKVFLYIHVKVAKG